MPSYGAAGVCVVLLAYGIWTKYKPGALVTSNESNFTDYKSWTRAGAADLELRSALLRHEKVVHPDVVNFDQSIYRATYKEDILLYIEELRGQAARNRRTNHVMQITTIVGSLAATGMTSLSFGFPAFGVVALVTNFVVGVAAGVAGYLKFKDRSFYAQQTANAIEQEWYAFNLGIERYKGLSQDDAKVEFAEEVHRLRVEQKNREENLDQPTKSSTESE